MELCVFQGTFNPIHNAHIDIAEYALKHFAKDGIIFIPAYKPPHKTSVDNMSIHRLNMVKLAVGYNPKFYVSDIEYKRSGKSYTYLTILQLYEIYKPTNKIKFIIGTDAFKQIETWYETDKLKNLVDFFVFPRENNFDSDELKLFESKGYSYTVLPHAYNDISSTKLRDYIKQGMSLDNLVPNKVEEYIKKYDLYND